MVRQIVSAGRQIVSTPPVIFDVGDSSRGEGRWRVPSGECRVASAEWRVASAEWRVASGEWRVASGEWRVASAEWRVTSGECRVPSDEWRVASGEWRVASGEWRVASGEWRVASGEWRVASGEWRVARPPARPPFSGPRVEQPQSARAGKRVTGERETGEGRGLWVGGFWRSLLFFMSPCMARQIVSTLGWHEPRLMRDESDRKLQMPRFV
jgi:hypothetical protein